MTTLVEKILLIQKLKHFVDVSCENNLWFRNVGDIFKPTQLMQSRYLRICTFSEEHCRF